MLKFIKIAWIYADVRFKDLSILFFFNGNEVPMLTTVHLSLIKFWGKWRDPRSNSINNSISLATFRQFEDVKSDYFLWQLDKKFVIMNLNESINEKRTWKLLTIRYNVRGKNLILLSIGTFNILFFAVIIASPR